MIVHQVGAKCDLERKALTFRAEQIVCMLKRFKKINTNSAIKKEKVVCSLIKMDVIQRSIV